MTGYTMGNYPYEYGAYDPILQNFSDFLPKGEAKKFQKQFEAEKKAHIKALQDYYRKKYNNKF